MCQYPADEGKATAVEPEGCRKQVDASPRYGRSQPREFKELFAGVRPG